MLVPEAIKAGIEIRQTIGDFPTLQAHMNDPNSEFNMFNLATGFAQQQWVWRFYSIERQWMLSGHNNNFLEDQEIYDIALRMSRVQPEDWATWDSLWVDFQVRWNYLQPDIPLYSDLYFDFFPSALKNYVVTPQWHWAYAVQRAWFE